MKLAGKVALVTGAQQGIGAAIGRALAEEGADVALSWLDDQPGAEAVANYARQAGRRAHLIKADVARLADIEAMVAETVRVLGAPDILVNNAGVYPRVKLLEMRESDWDYVLDINLKAGCFADHRRRQGADRGRQARRLGDQPLLAGDPRRGARRALQREQGRRGVDDARAWRSSSRPTTSASMPSRPAPPTPPSRATATPTPS